MRIVRPFRSFSVARGCARVDSTLDTAKICSDRRVDADSPRLRAVFGGGKTFLHSLDPKRTSGLGRAAIQKCGTRAGVHPSGSLKRARWRDVGYRGLPRARADTTGTLRYFRKGCRHPMANAPLRQINIRARHRADNLN